MLCPQIWIRGTGDTVPYLHGPTASLRAADRRTRAPVRGADTLLADGSVIDVGPPVQRRCEVSLNAFTTAGPSA
ncbi:hypothetical protein GCM10010517_47440 [Streptosporangium fragile]|uniref:Uncharacterized protein n=1 Tax=Streptosporangium fragile TaxID=46186 RepID=A0ABN3W235_9ACTN